MSSGISDRLAQLSVAYAPKKMEVYGQKFGPPEPPPEGTPPPEQNGQMQQMQNDIWRLNMMQLPQNTGGAQLDIYGSGQIDPATGKPGMVDPQVAQARLQQVYQNRPDLIWPGRNPDGTIQMSYTGDRYDR